MEKERNQSLDEGLLQKIFEKNQGTVAEVILRLAWNVGFSREEIRQLTWNEVSFEEQLIRLPTRSVPMDEAMLQCLKARYSLCGHVSSVVVISDRNRKPMAPQSISRNAREVLDAGGLAEITLVDRRHDFIIRQLPVHDWPYVARISGMAVSTLYSLYGAYLPVREARPIEPKARPDFNEFELRKLLQVVGDTSAGLAIWMTWKQGMQVKEMIELVWNQVDLKKGLIHLQERTVSMESWLKKQLARHWEMRGENEDAHVLLKPQSKRPYDHAELSKEVRTALIRGGMEHLTLRDLIQEERWSYEDRQILHLANEQGNISRNNVMEVMNLSKNLAYQRLSRLVEAGKLVRVGTKYYPAGTAISSGEHVQLICAHLERVGSAQRKELATLLGIEGRQCQVILKHMVEEELLLRSGYKYSLPR